MSWPIKLRAISFSVTIGVTLMESVMAAIPIGLALRYFNVASSARIFEVLMLLAASVSISISIYSHVRPARLSGRARTRGAA